MSKRILGLCFGLLILFTIHSACAESYWPGLLGPSRNGWVTDFQSPAQWPDELTQVWQHEVGTGYGTPIVAQGFVYQHSRQGENEVVTCFDLDRGTVKWSQAYPVPFKIGGGGQKHGKGPKSSPIYADGRLFTVSITGVLSAWNVQSGELIWRKDYADQFQQFERPYPYWGAATSPIVYGDRLFVHVGADDAGVLVALDVDSGDEVWANGTEGASYSSPLIVELDGTLQVVEWNHEALQGVDIDSGQTLWRFAFPHQGSNQNMPTPVVHQGRLLLGGENRGILGIDARRVNGKWEVLEKWHQTEVALDMSTAVINGETLYGFSHYGAGRLFSLDPSNGKVRWSGPGRTGENVSFLAIPNHVLALKNDGKLLVLATKPDRYEVVAQYQVADSETWAPPVLLSDGLLIKDETSLTRWNFPTR